MWTENNAFNTNNHNYTIKIMYRFIWLKDFVHIFECNSNLFSWAEIITFKCYIFKAKHSFCSTLDLFYQVYVETLDMSILQYTEMKYTLVDL